MHGIFGTSPLASIIDIVNSIPVDYMHAVLEVVTRLLMKSWFDGSFHSSPFYIGWHVVEINHHLLQQHPPNEFSHPPRSIKRHMNYWKASELKTWLLFYSLPLLLDFLPSLYWHHYPLLVNAMHFLLSSTTTNLQIDAAEQMLHDFYTLSPNCMVKANALLMHTCFAIWLNMFNYRVHFGHSQCYVFDSNSNNTLMPTRSQKLKL